MKKKFNLEKLLKDTAELLDSVLPAKLEKRLEDTIYRDWASCILKEEGRTFETVEDIGKHYDPFLQKFSIEFNARVGTNVAKRLRSQNLLT